MTLYLCIYLIERTAKTGLGAIQHPQKFPQLEPGLAFVQRRPFTTNTNWQVYLPRAIHPELPHAIAGLAYHNFSSAAAVRHSSGDRVIARQLARKGNGQHRKLSVVDMILVVFSGMLLPVCLVVLSPCGAKVSFIFEARIRPPI